MEKDDDELKRPSRLLEYVKRMKEIEALENKRKRTKRLFSTALSLSVTILSAMTLTLLISGTSGTISKDYFSKNIKTNISLAVNNDASLDVIKNIYNSREVKSPNPIKDIFNKVEEEYYIEGTPLSKILEDLKTDYFLSTTQDSVYMKKYFYYFYSFSN